MAVSAGLQARDASTLRREVRARRWAPLMVRAALTRSLRSRSA